MNSTLDAGSRKLSEFGACRAEALRRRVGRSTFLRAVISAKKLRTFRQNLRLWYGEHRRDLPWRRTRDPYAILVSEVMLQQTQVATVLPYYNRWLRRFPTVKALARASENDVLRAWQGLGYYARARNLHAAARLIVAEHRGDFPTDPDEIKKLPGVGRYTANAISTFAFDRAVPIVEANTTRLLARLFRIATPVDSGAGREALWQAGEQLVPKRQPGAFNSALLDLGALVCRPEPRCNICPVRKQCHAPDPKLFPARKPRPSVKRMTENHSFVANRRGILLEQSHGRWRGMWTLPPLAAQRRVKTAIHISTFPFTNHRITLRVFDQPRIKAKKNARQKWVSIEQLDSIPIPSPHHRAIAALLRPI